jgi:hypothetical protein
MKSIHILLFSLVCLLVLTAMAAFWAPIPDATGVPHPEFKGMMISTANIDEAPHTRWMGYLFGLAVIGVFGSFLFLGNRKKGQLTPMKKWLWIGLGLYTMVYTCMVVSHWNYVANDGGPFILSMPAPTAWMIIGVWFVPIIITLTYIIKFEDWIISDDEIKEFHEAVGISES